MKNLHRYIKLANLLDELEHYEAAEIIDEHIDKQAAQKKDKAWHMASARRDIVAGLMALDEGNIGTSSDMLKHAVYELNMAMKKSVADLQLEMEKEVEEKEEGDEEETEEVEVSKKKKLVLKFD